MKKLTKALVLLLSVALICTGLIMVVNADETAVDLASLITSTEANAEGVTEITLTEDAKLDTAYTVDKDITINLAGHTITVTAADAFIFNSAKTVKITGDGVINLAGNLVNSKDTIDAGYTFEMTGTKEISVNHTGTAAKTIVHAGGGTHKFTKVNFTSTKTGGSYWDAAFRGTLATETVSDANRATDGTAKNLKFYFDSVYYYHYASVTGAMNQYAFLMPTGSGSYFNIKNSNIQNAGTLLYMGYTTEDALTDVLGDVDNSILRMITKNITQRSCLVFNHKQNADEGDHYGTINLKNGSFIGGNCYRGIHAGDKKTSIFQVVLDNSTFANNGAMQNNGTGNTDSMLVRGALIHAKNGSTLISSGTGLIGANGAIKAEVGTRFADYQVATASVITWVDATGAAATGVSVVLDPLNNIKAPYVSTTNAQSAYTAGASAIRMYGMDGFRGGNSKSEYGFRVDGVGSTYSTDRATNANNTKDFWPAELNQKGKSGAVTRFDYGTNSGLKWWMNPTTEAPNYGDVRTIPSSDDGYVVLGSYRHVSQSIATIANNKVLVFDMDIACDSEYGFMAFDMKIGARDDSENGKEVGNMLTLNTDGSISNASLKSFDSSIKLNYGEWNHMTFVVYTDTTYNSSIGQVYVYVNGELLGYNDGAYQSGATFIQGVRLNVKRGTNQVVGSSTLFDNLMVRAYDNYYDSNEADGAAKNAGAYLINDDLKNTSPIGNTIQTLGKPYSTITEAINAANTLGVNAYLTGKPLTEQQVQVNGTIIGDYDVKIKDTSYGFIKADGKYTFDSDYYYNAYWFTGDSSSLEDIANDEKYLKTTAKLGFELNHDFIYTDGEPDYTKLQVITQSGWANATGKTESATPIIPGMTELTEAKADANRIVRFYPVISAVDMIYYVEDSNGAAVDGGVTGAAALESLKTLGNGEKFVLRSDVLLPSSNGIVYANTANEDVYNLYVDLAGHTLAQSVAGAMFQVGNNINLTVYSSVAGGALVADVVNGAAIEDGTAFAISNGMNNSVLYGMQEPAMHKELLNYDGTTYSKRTDVKNATVTVGKYESYPGTNMSVVASIAYNGYIGDESCAINSDGVNLITESLNGGYVQVQTYTFDGNINVKNCVIFAANRDNVVDNRAFSVGAKTSGARFEGFENIKYTGLISLDNVYIVNKLTRVGDNNIVSNNGDDTNLGIKLHNVVTTGRINPSNATRNIMDGFVAAEVHGALSANPTEGTVRAKYGAPMTWQILDLGITENYITFSLPMYSAEAGEIVNYKTYNIANNGADISSLDNAYTLPVLAAEANVYESDIINVLWKDLTGATVDTENYVSGGRYQPITAPAATVTSGSAINLVSSGWKNIPAEGAVINETVEVTYDVTANANIADMKVNLSIYSDFIMNLYVPVQYKNYITEQGTEVTIGENTYIKYSVKINAKDAAEKQTFTLTVNETINGVEYTAVRTVEMSIVQYASAILVGEHADTEKTLVYYMLKYANEAIKYANGGVGNTEIEGYLELYSNYATAIEKNYDVKDVSVMNSVFSGAAIRMTEVPAFVFYLNGDFEGTVTVRYGTNGVRTYNIEKGMKYLVINTMKVYDFAENLQIEAVGTIGNSTETVTVTGEYNLDTYADYITKDAADMLSDTNADSLKVLALVEALYEYATVAASNR